MEESSKTRKEGRAVEETFSLENIHTLVVDDESVARLVITKQLQKAGYTTVIAVDSAPKALDLLKKETFQLIICDVKMPEMNGIEFLGALQKDERFANIPVIMMSAVDELQLVYQCILAGASDFLTKPIKQGVVQNLWQNLWRKKKERQLLDLYQHAKGANARTEEELNAKLRELTLQVNEAVSTPIKAISEALIKLCSDGSLNDSARTTVSEILKKLQDSNIFRVAVESFIQDKTDQLDSVTREWFAHEFSISTRRELRKSPSFSSGISLKKSPNPGLAEKLRLWDFDVWQISDDATLFSLINSMFGDFGLLEHFRVDLKDFQKLLVEIRKLYLHTNPYHNFRHAFDVTHMVYLLLTNANGTAFLSSIEVFALMLSGLLHDVDHPGLNNTYQIATSSELAIIYNDQSVLENHHCATAFKLLKKHNILKNIAKDDFQRLRKLMIDMILATDLAKHMQNVSAFQSFLESNPTPDRDNDEHRAVIGKMILKSADLCNPAKPFRIARYWAEMIQEEFFLQGEREQVDGLPISPFMKRGASSLPQMQVNFATFIVIPLFQVLGKILPEVEKVVLPILLDNREKWSELLKAELN